MKIYELINNENVYWFYYGVLRTTLDHQYSANPNKHRRTSSIQEVANIFSMSRDVRVTLIQFATMKKAFCTYSMCSGIFEVIADHQNKTKIIGYKLLVTFQDRNYDTTIAWRTHSVGENDDIQTFQESLGPQEGINLSIEFFRVNIHSRIDTTRQDTT